MQMARPPRFELGRCRAVTAIVATDGLATGRNPVISDNQTSARNREASENPLHSHYIVRYSNSDQSSNDGARTMGTKERRFRERQETREKILDAAREMFAEEGFEAVTMRAIAARMEYTPPAIYHHFENKHALVSELCQRDFTSLASHFRGSATAGDPVERIMAVGEAYLRFAEQYPAQYRVMFMTVLPHVEFPEQYVREARNNPERDAYAFLRDACRGAIEQGRLRPEIVDADQLAQVLWAGVHGLVSLRIAKRHQDWIPWRDLRQSARMLMEIHLHGMLRDPGTA